MAMAEEEKERPVWLEQWMSDQAINELYSEGLRLSALKQLHQLKNSSIEWTKHSLRGVFGEQHCSYRLASNGQWVPRCTCGLAGSYCMHTYMLHVLLKKVCNEEGWQFPGEVAVAPTAAVEVQEEAVATPEVTKTNPAPVRRHQGEGRTLEVEADFRYNPCNVVIRFYVKEGGLRSLEDLCWVRDYAVELLQGNPKGWNEADQEFLLWVSPILRKRKVRELMNKLLVLTKDEFKRWMDRWGQVSRRIFDKDTQVCLNEKMFRTPVRMQVEVYRANYNLVIGCAFYLDDGRKFFLHELVDMIRHDPTGYYIATLLKGYVPVVSWDSLMENFGACRLNISENEMLKRLPYIVEHHLEVIGETSLVTIRTVDVMSLSVYACVDRRGFLAVMLRGRTAGQEIRSGIYKRGGAYEVVLAENKYGEKLRKSLLEHGATRDANDGNCYYWHATSENADSLRRIWQDLPKSVEKRGSTDLKELLSDEGCKLELQVSLQQSGLLVDARARCTCAGVEVDSEEICQAAAAGRNVVRGWNGHWFSLGPSELSDFIESLRGAGLEQGHRLMLPAQLSENKIVNEKHGRIHLEGNSQELLERYSSMERLKIPAPSGILAEFLREYQKDGIQFLADRIGYGVGAILADDMGLGKTLETLTLLLNWFEGVGKLRALVVSPSSVTDVWRREAVAYCSELRCVVIHGSQQERERQLSGEAELFVTSYALVRMDIEFLTKQKFDVVVLDEAQQIKNPDAQITQCVKRLNSRCRLALTGTPLENRLADVCSILEYVNPGSMEYVNFARDAEGGMNMVREWLKLVMLRRTKAMVNLQLPPKTEEIIRLEMPSEVRQAYLQELEKARERAKGGNRIQVLAEITRMRRFCCSPSLVSTEPVEELKLDFLMERVEDLLAGGHSILVFSQFTSLLDLAKERLELAGHPYRMITGETPVEKRGDIAKEFNESSEAMVFLLSLKAAGTGLTLTRADYVFLLDPWWNPSVENQAIDRTHRIGQTNPVFAYKLILADTIEENVMRIIENKRLLFAEMIDDAADATGATFSEEDLLGLLSYRGKQEE